MTRVTGTGDERVDLHVHTYFSSEGRYSPRALVRLAAERDMTAIAIADHDTMDGYSIAAATGRHHGVEVIPCVELTASVEQTEVNLLAYFLSPTSFEVGDFLATARRLSVERARALVNLLRRRGYEVTFDGAQRGNPHATPSAAAIVRTALAHPANRHLPFLSTYQRQAAGQGRSVLPPELRGAFDGLAAPSAASTIEFIRSNDGVPVLAHPSRSMSGERRYGVVVALAMAGLCGIEAYSPHHDHGVTRELVDLAERFELEATAGSGFYGATTPGAGPGDVPGGNLPGLVQRIRSHQLLF